MANNKQQPQVVYVKQSHGCLVTALVFVLFGWIGLLVMAVWKMIKLAWSWAVTVGWKWPVALTKATWNGCVVATRYAVRYGRVLYARYVTKQG